MKDLINKGELYRLKEYVYDNKVIILEYSKAQRKLFLNMLSTLTNNKKSATVDIGFSGTSEGYIRDLINIEKSDIDIEHLILMGSDGAQINNLMNKLKIYSWLGMAGENTDLTKAIMYQIQILEVLINDICGTTMKYKSDAHGNATYELDDKLPDGIESNNKRALACQRGIYSFITIWLKYRRCMDVEKLIEDKIGFINIWRRAIECPSYDEARMLGDLMLYDNYTVEKKLFKVRCDYEKDIEDIPFFLQDVNKTLSEYPQGIVAFKYPNYFKEKLLEEKLQIPGIKKIINVVNELHKTGNKEPIAIFAAGQRGRDFLNVAKLLDLNITCFIDSNSSIQGTIIDGIPVIPISNAGSIRIFVNSSYNYPDEINQIIKKNCKNKKIKIYTL